MGSYNQHAVCHGRRGRGRWDDTRQEIQSSSKPGKNRVPLSTAQGSSCEVRHGSSSGRALIRDVVPEVDILVRYMLLEAPVQEPNQVVRIAGGT